MSVEFCRDPLSLLRFAGVISENPICSDYIVGCMHACMTAYENQLFVSSKILRMHDSRQAPAVTSIVPIIDCSDGVSRHVSRLESRDTVFHVSVLA